MDRINLVPLEQLSVAMIDETLPGRIIPPDHLVVSDYTEGEQIICHLCHGVYFANMTNTALATFVDHPELTHVEHWCPGPDCVVGSTLRPYGVINIHIDEDHLQRYFDSGYPLMLGLDVQVPMMQRFYPGYINGPTELQHTIYAAIVAQVNGPRLSAGFDDLLAPPPQD